MTGHLTVSIERQLLPKSSATVIVELVHNKLTDTVLRVAYSEGWGFQNTGLSNDVC